MFFCSEMSINELNRKCNNNNKYINNLYWANFLKIRARWRNKTSGFSIVIGKGSGNVVNNDTDIYIELIGESQTKCRWRIMAMSSSQDVKVLTNIQYFIL